MGTVNKMPKQIECKSCLELIKLRRIHCIMDFEKQKMIWDCQNCGFTNVTKFEDVLIPPPNHIF